MKHIGDLIIHKGDTRDLSGITEVTGSVEAYDGSTVSLPACTSVGRYVVADGGSIDLPACTRLLHGESFLAAKGD